MRIGLGCRAKMATGGYLLKQGAKHCPFSFEVPDLPIFMYNHMHVYIYICVIIYIYSIMSVQLCLYIYIHTISWALVSYIYIYICIYIYMCVCDVTRCTCYSYQWPDWACSASLDSNVTDVPKPYPAAGWPLMSCSQKIQQFNHPLNQPSNPSRTRTR